MGAAFMLGVCMTASAGLVSAERITLQQDNGTLLVPVVINGQLTLSFTIDSGASDVTIPADVFSTLLRTGSVLKTDFVDTQRYKLADGSIANSQRVRLRSLRVGTVTLRDVIASVTPQSSLLLLGQSFLSRIGTWSIDNARHQLILNESAAGVPSVASEAATAGPPPTPQDEFTPLLRSASDCVDAVGKSREAVRLQELGLLGGAPTVGQMTNNRYASAEDSGMATAYVSRMRACWAPVHLPGPDDSEKVFRIFTWFANGTITYGVAAVLIRAEHRKAMAEFEAAQHSSVPGR
jgi:clan AA aspartic protease (TIGR02281 family)